MKMPVYMLTAEDKLAFIQYVKFWGEKLGLQDWRITVAKKAASGSNMAEVKIFHKNRMANVYLGKDFGQNTPVTPESLEKTALHELLHVFMAEITNQIEYGITGESLESAEHRVIHILEERLTKKT